MDFVNIVNYCNFMEKNKIKNNENGAQITSSQDHNEHKTRAIYLRDDHCDWGSSGMNEYTEEYQNN